MTARYLYSSRFSVELGALALYDRWYVQHANDLLGVGMRAVHGFRSSVAPRALSNVYELDSLDVFGDDYAAVRERDTLGLTVRPRLTPAELDVFEVISTAGLTALPAPGVVLFDFAAEDAGVAEWYSRSELNRLSAREGTVGVALGAAVDAPVAPIGAAQFRLVMTADSAAAAFRLSDELIIAYASQWSAPPPFAHVDVLTHRVSFGGSV